VPIVSVNEELIGLGVYMNIHALDRLLDEPYKVTGAAIMVDFNHSGALYQRLKAIPSIIGLNITSVMRQIFEDILAENMLKMVSMNIIFASFISFGVIYNTARIALSERGQELANLRVLGLTQAEVAYLLFGELMVIVLVAIPVGIFSGNFLSEGMVRSMDSELFRVPYYIENSTIGFAVLIVLISTFVSFYLVWRRVDAIDLVSAQKGVN
jgi:putative ABC transport system permease protein